MGDIFPIPPRRPVVPPMATVSPIGSNRLSFSVEKVLKLTHSKVETQICGRNTRIPTSGEGGGEGGGVGERRELMGRWEKMGKVRGGGNKARERGMGRRKSRWHPSYHQTITKSTLL